MTIAIDDSIAIAIESFGFYFRHAIDSMKRFYSYSYRIILKKNPAVAPRLSPAGAGPADRGQI